MAVTSGILLGIDAGQTFTKAVLFDLEGRELAVASTSISTSSPRPSWQERDMDLTWERTAEAIRACLGQVGAARDSVLAVGICGHNDGVYLVDSNGRPVRPAILATDARAIVQADRLAAGPRRGRALELTGQVPAPYSPSALLTWLAEYEPESISRTRWQISCKDWLRYRLTGEVATDPTEASASFTAVRTQDWSEEVLDLYRLGELANRLPTIIPSHAVAGSVTAEAAEATGLATGTPVVTGAHDVDAAALGIGAAEPGNLSIVMGTFSINQIVSGTPVPDTRWQARTFLEPGEYLHMSTSPSSASNFEWAMRVLRPNGSSPDYAAAVADARIGEPDRYEDSPLFLPYLFGSPAPMRNPGGTWSGIRGSHNRDDLVRAVLEGIVHNHRWHIDALRERFEVKGAARVCGGGAKNDQWTQLMADTVRLPLEITDADEAGARGAAMLAGIGSGIYADAAAAARAAVRVTRRFEPSAAWADLADRRHTGFLALAQAMAGISG